MLDVDASFGSVDASSSSFTEYAREYHVKLVAFTVELASFFDQRCLRSRDQPEKVFRLFGLFDTTADGKPETLFREAFVRLSVIGADARAAPYKLINEAVGCGATRNLFRKAHNRLAELCGSLFQIKYVARVVGSIPLLMKE